MPSTLSSAINKYTACVCVLFYRIGKLIIKKKPGKENQNRIHWNRKSEQERHTHLDKERSVFFFWLASIYCIQIKYVLKSGKQFSIL